MSLGTPLAVLVAILFLVPGLLWLKAMELASPYMLTPRRDWLECLMLSCVNYLLGSLLIYHLLKRWPHGLDIAKPETVAQHVFYLAWWVALIFLLPLIAGYSWGRIRKSRPASNVFRRLKMRVIHTAPTAWDYAFAREEGYWARVELTNGARIEGVFGSNSLVSTESSERDIFLERVRQCLGLDDSFIHFPVTGNNSFSHIILLCRQSGIGQGGYARQGLAFQKFQRGASAG